MDASSFTGSDRFLKAAELNGQTVRLTIESVESELFQNEKGEELKLVLYFKGRKKGAVMNKTNSRNMVDGHNGDTETDNWTGTVVDVRPNQTSMGLGLTIMVAADEAFDDEIKF